MPKSIAPVNLTHIKSIFSVNFLLILVYVQGIQKIHCVNLTEVIPILLLQVAQRRDFPAILLTGEDTLVFAKLILWSFHSSPCLQICNFISSSGNVSAISAISSEYRSFQAQPTLNSSVNRYQPALDRMLIYSRSYLTFFADSLPILPLLDVSL